VDKNECAGRDNTRNEVKYRKQTQNIEYRNLLRALMRHACSHFRNLGL